MVEIHPKYTFESVRQEALKYSSREDFKRGNSGAYQYALRNKILNEICSHMKLMKHKWTREELQQEALKYKTRKEFQEKNRNAYVAANSRKMLDEICSHMTYLKSYKVSTNRTKKTNEEIFDEAKKYKSRKEFYLKSTKHYQTALYRGILDEACSHMEAIYQQWNLNSIKGEALKYKTRYEFEKNSPNAHAAARRANILDEVCSHMEYVKEYWNEEKILEEAKKYKTRIDFKNNSNGAYQAALRLGKSKNFFNHMDKLTRDPWTAEELREETLKYKTKNEFITLSGGAYTTACKLNILDEICSHMKKSANSSSQETGLFNTIKQKYPKTQKLRDRKISIHGKPHIKGLDIDIYIPELRKGIEFDGKYWHSIDGLKKSRSHWPEEDLENYHQIKDEYFKSKGIDILHIKEEEWLENKEECIKKCMEFLK